MKNAARAIAEQTLRYSCADGREERIHVALYAPRSEEIDWSCRLTVTGFSRKVRRSAWGVDAMQALVLAIHILPLELRSFVEGEPGHFIDQPDLGIDRTCRMNLDPEAATNEFVAHYVRQLARAEPGSTSSMNGDVRDLIDEIKEGVEHLAGLPSNSSEAFSLAALIRDRLEDLKRRLAE